MFVGNDLVGFRISCLLLSVCIAGDISFNDMVVFLLISFYMMVLSVVFLFFISFAVWSSLAFSAIGFDGSSSTMGRGFVI